MKCSNCGDTFTSKSQVINTPYYGIWRAILNIITCRHSCPGKIRDLDHYCVICGEMVTIEGHTAHIIRCIHGIKIYGGTNIKIGNVRGVDEYVKTGMIFTTYPQLLVVNGLGINWLSSEDDYGDYDDYNNDRILEIIAKKLEIMNFHCMICGSNYETFPTGEILLTHLIDCVKARSNAKLN